MRKLFSIFLTIHTSRVTMKRKIKGRVIMLPTLRQRCLVVLYLVIAVLFTSFLSFVRDASTGIPVLNYHQINDRDHNALTVPVSEFEREMAYLKAEGYTAITPEQLSNHLKYGSPLPPKPVMITFDDGYRDNYTNAFPILKKYGFTASIFLISDFTLSHCGLRQCLG